MTSENKERDDTYVDAGFVSWFACLGQQAWTRYDLYDKNLIGCIQSFLTHTTKHEVLRHARSLIQHRKLVMDRLPLPLWPTLERIVAVLHTTDPKACTIPLRQRLVGKTMLCDVLALAEQMTGRHVVHFVSASTRGCRYAKERHDEQRLETAPSRPIQYIRYRQSDAEGVFICDMDDGVVVFRRDKSCLDRS